ncbi:MAG: hypothetical protein R3F16_22620 [Myxococcota bacterium]|nr:hypothetical protein [Myxococcales bacterium]
MMDPRRALALLGAAILSWTLATHAFPSRPASALADPPVASLAASGASTDAQAGFELVETRPATIRPRVRGYGRILDPLPIVEAIALRDAAKAASDQTRAELARVRTLARNEENASIRELQLAIAAEARAASDLETARARLVGLVGPELERDRDLSALARRLRDRETSLVRVGVPGDPPALDPEQGVELTTRRSQATAKGVRFVGVAPLADPGLPGAGWLFLVVSPMPAPGTPVFASIQTGGGPIPGGVVPCRAILRNAGRELVFVRLGDGSFERREVVMVESGSDDCFLSSGVAPGERVVATGAQQLLSSELLGTQDAASP